MAKGIIKKESLNVEERLKAEGTVIGLIDSDSVIRVIHIGGYSYSMTILIASLVFQNEQESQNKRNSKELIQRYDAKIMHEKQHILALKKDISLSDKIILDLQKYNRNSDSLVTCISMSAALEREEELLQIQLENAINTSESDKKTYQDSIKQCNERLKQHEEKYMEFTCAKKYHMIKEEYDNFLNLILKYDEQQKRKDKIILDILEPASFASYIDWSLRLATLRKNTEKTIHHISQKSHTTSEMVQKIKELERKIKYIEEVTIWLNLFVLKNQTKRNDTRLTTELHTKEISEKENDIGRKESNKDLTTEFQQANLNEEARLKQSKENKSHLLHLPDLLQKFMQPPRENRVSLHISETETNNIGNVDDPQNSNSIVSNQDLRVENEIQEPVINNGSEGFTPPTTNLQHQSQLREISIARTDVTRDKTVPIENYSIRLDISFLLALLYYDTGKKAKGSDIYEPAVLQHIFCLCEMSQCSDRNAIILQARTDSKANPFKEHWLSKKQTKSEDNSSLKSQIHQEIQGNSVSYEDMESKADGETSPNEVFALPRIPSPFTVPDPPPISTHTSIRKGQRNKGKKSQNITKYSIDLFSRSTEQTEASPCLSLFKTSTPKTPNLCSFESFSTVVFADQQDSFTAADINPASPAKDIGNLFQKMEGDDDFPFLFTSKSSQASDDDKDDFGFMLPFGQDSKSPMELESAQNKTKFTFF
ncbi:protein SIX6OS1 [Bufo gargarizans]|uniref:protein SIX6OS1 n=1 Tax=Bufo gargarizans TaxID=30331 RepID=UPI001CF4EFE3|nr:protein SIX6OS1 [Bufo gargarizans]